ncbi:MAG: DUF547 domain-containing protein [Rhodobacteraceae bacterium]|nr:DUF547 domain-containing protein [Paracoccaceae bacterium]
MILPAFGSIERLFAPDANLWPRWEAHNPASTSRVNHGAWAGLLDRYRRDTASGVALFAYGAVTSEDRAQLERYLSQLAGTPVSTLNRDEQFAYWVNLYNALTIKVILDHYPVESIRDIRLTGGIGSGPWNAKLIRVEGTELSLNDIEHRILRPIWNDPRVHYAVNCASIGCPNLAPEPWTARGLDRALDTAARAYVNDARGIRFSNGRASASRIYDWFVDDFGGNEAGVIAHLERYASPQTAARLDAAGGLSGQHYDWSLNEAAR